MNELFDIPETKSPRLKWMEAHLIAVGENIFTPTHSDDFRHGYTRRADCATGSGYGNTDDEALVDLAKRQGWRLWNEQ